MPVSESRPFRIGIDIGGTFTDLLLVDDRSGATTMVKVLTTAEPEQGVETALREALARSGATARAVNHVVHGTTLVTNAIIERKGDPTALLTTRGFRDALEIRREHRYDMYDLFLQPPVPLVPRHLRFEIDERMLADGSALREPAVAEVERLAGELAARGIRTVAVSLLHAYRNDAHEQLVRQAIARAAPGIDVSLSSAIAPEIKEYERTSTTVCNAYVARLVGRYLAEVERRLAAMGFETTLYVMLSSGGLATADTGRRFPIRLLESGPAAGALAAAHVGAQAGITDLMSFDMGGTTAKVAVIEGGAPLQATQFEVDRVDRFKKGSGLPVRTPVVELIEIGAGGGSIARVDRMNRLRIGPESAGASPGPACYGRGGVDPTVTDADLVLGYLDPGFFLGGAMALDLDAARSAIATRIAAPLRLTVEAAAWAIHHVVNENMANAARIHAADRGKDPRRFPLFAFGGAGPVHAVGVAALLGSPSVLLPLGAGVGSTLGFLSAPLAFDFARSSVEALDAVDWPRAERLRREMQAEGIDLLLRAGVPAADMSVVQTVDMRYAGQGHDVTVTLDTGPYDAHRTAEMAGCFTAAYATLYGRLPGDLRMETVSWRLRVQGPSPHLAVQLPAIAAGDEDASVSGDRGQPPGAARGDGRAPLGPSGPRRRPMHGADGVVDAGVYDRYALRPGARVPGPAIVEERESTVVIPPGWSGTVDAAANLVLRRADGQ